MADAFGDEIRGERRPRPYNSFAVSDEDA